MDDILPVEGDLIDEDHKSKNSLAKPVPVLLNVGTVQKLRVLGRLPPENIGKDIDSIGATSLEKRQYRVAFGM